MFFTGQAGNPLAASIAAGTFGHPAYPGSGQPGRQ
jgi:hypothetical protein